MPIPNFFLIKSYVITTAYLLSIQISIYFYLRFLLKYFKKYIFDKYFFLIHISVFIYTYSVHFKMIITLATDDLAFVSRRPTSD